MVSLSLADLAGVEVRAGGFDKAVLPIGATEFHGDHLPYGTDTLTAETLARRFAADLGGMLVLPTLPYGPSAHHLAFPWTLSIQPTTLTALVTDLAESLLHHGLRKLLVVTAHDGNPAPVEIACRALHARHGLSAALFSGWQGKAQALLAPRGLAIDLDHAGESEMSLVLYAAPHLAQPERAADRPGEAVGLPVQVFGGYDQIMPDGYGGAASQGSAEQGRAIVEALAGWVVPCLRRLDAHGWQPGPWLGED
ncbi:MAG: creatininase family protein [Chloroflexi bacterium]|nr:creatininase family protein [Chloroflexota bacterium]